MIPQNFFNVSNAQVAKHDGIAVKIEGFYRSATAQAWLQVFDTNAAPANGTVPLKQELINGTSPFYFEFKRGDLVFYLGCFVGISSTEGTYTASADVMDLSVELSDPDLPASVSYAGDLTSPVTGLQVWTEAAGLAARKSLVALEVDGTNLTTATQFIMLFATDAVNPGDFPISGGIFPIGVGQVLTGESKLNFGEFGRQIFSLDADAKTQRLGLTVKISSTPGTYTAANGTARIKAEYRTEP
ncbi:MAG: hypothetical protein KGL39_15660 [Patescibacteria group bacterium]|nr:hypothetical protein [Patescibacteria group bacterium]